MKNVERTLKALANRRRLAILRYLKVKKEASVGDIAKAIRLSVKSTSKHLVILASVDILEKEQRNLYMYYRLAAKQESLIRTLLSIL